MVEPFNQVKEKKYTLEKLYKGLKLRVVIENEEIALLVGKSTRAKQNFSKKQGAQILSTSIQTGYEWHEQVEVFVTRSSDKVAMILKASGHEIARK